MREKLHSDNEFQIEKNLRKQTLQILKIHHRSSQSWTELNLAEKGS